MTQIFYIRYVTLYRLALISLTPSFIKISLNRTEKKYFK